mgnify:CR=1 FL=1
MIVGGIFRLISIVALLAVLGISYLLFQNVKQTKETQDLNVQLVEMRQEAETEEDNTDWSKGMLDVNPDYKGWLTIYGTQISEPVVQGETNETYLRTNINGEHAEAGTLFLDETTDLTQDGNLIIYGHKMNDGTMFAVLQKMADEVFRKKHSKILLQTSDGLREYRIAAVLKTDIQKLPFNRTEFADDADFLSFQEELFAQSLYESQTIHGEDCRLLTLVTCSYEWENARTVVIAAEVR